MKIKHNKEIENAIINLSRTMDENERKADILNSYLGKKCNSAYEYAEKQYQKGRPEKEAFLASFKYLSIENKPLLSSQDSLDAIRALNQEIFAKNPYYQTIHFLNKKKNSWELRQSSYKPFQGFVCDEIIINEKDYFKETTPFGFFLEEFPYLEILENNKNWMSLTPHEILTMNQSIQEAKGNVLTFGLGMGYYAFMASMKTDVKEVTIVEKDATAISLFCSFILPHFPNKQKIKIVQEDAFAFAKRPLNETYDSIFVDIWHLPFDGLFLYLRFKNLFRNLTRPKISYWIEKSILALLRRALIVLIEEEYQGSNDENYLFSNNETDTLINSLHFLLKEKRINCAADLMNLLKDDNLKGIAANCLRQ